MAEQESTSAGADAAPKVRASRSHAALYPYPRAAGFLLLGWLAVAAPLEAITERHHFTVYSVKEGLAQSQVTAIHQDRAGYLWVGTAGGGLSRFGGREFETFTVDDGLSSNSVTAILEDRSGALWFGTKHGLTKFEGGRFTRVDLVAGSHGSIVRSLFEDRSGTLWVGTEQGVSPLGDGIVGSAAISAALEGQRVQAICEDTAGALWFATAGRGTWRFDDGKLRNLSTAEGLPSDHVLALLCDSTGGVWIGTGDGVVRDHAGTLSSPIPPGTLPYPVRALLETRSGDIWLGTSEGGACRWRHDDLEFFTEATGLTSNSVWSLAEDREGNLWFGTYRGGLVKYSGARFVRFAADEELGRDVVRSILRDRHGNLWFATYRHGVIRYDGSTLTTVSRSDGLPSDFVLTLGEDHLGTIWIGTFAGLARYDGEAVRPVTVVGGPGRKVIRAIYEDPRGNLWVGTDKDGIFLFDRTSWHSITEAEGLASNRVMALAGGRDSDIWIGTLAGITRFDGREFHDFSDQVGLPPQEVYTLVEDGDGDLWIAAYGEGILRCPGSANAGACEKLTESDGLISKTVVSLAFDPAGQLWVGTERGVSRLELSAGRRFRSFDSEEGFTAVECIHNALLADRDGNLWFGTVSGVVRYAPEHDRENLVAPITHITGVRLFHGTESLTPYASGIGSDGLPTRLRLPHRSNHLTFDFLGISLTSPSQVSYRYRLRGLEPQWSPETAVAHATYSSLPPGSYTFEVQAANGNGIRSPRSATFRFEIRPPLWRTGWFLLASAVVLVAAISGIVSLRTRALESQRRLLERKVRESTEQLEVEKRRVEEINRKLESRVAARTAELAAANQSLRAEMEERARLENELLQAKKLESLGVLAGGIAHDFNNLLTGVLGNLSLAKTRIPDTAEVFRLVSEAEVAAERTRTLTRQLLTFSTGGHPIKRSLALSKLVPESIRFAVHGSKVESRIDIPADIWPVAADGGQLSQVLHNLATNAVRAMPSGGVLTTACRNVTMGSERAEQLEPGRYVLITVEDQGKGIPSEVLPHIFDPYFTTQDGGSGLGLAVVYSIVSRHGGHISVTSELGVGTRFSIHLPAASEPPESGDSEAMDPHAGGGRVLIMDDDPVVRTVSTAMLEKLGYRVEATSNGDQAIAKYEAALACGEVYDFVILDLTVQGGMGGDEAIRKLRKLDPGIRAIVSSGYSNDLILSRFAEHGFLEILPKPFTLKHLTQTLARAAKAAPPPSGGRS